MLQINYILLNINDEWHENNNLKLCKTVQSANKKTANGQKV